MGFRWRRTALTWSLVTAFFLKATTHGVQGAEFAQMDSAQTVSGYLARLLINEVPFPGERAYVSEVETRTAMLQILWVLHSRLRIIPPGYRQEQIAGVRADDVIDVICGSGDRRQCEGFYREASGQFVADTRVEDRLNYLLGIANSGGKAGRFASLLNFGRDLARAYVNEGIKGTDRYARLTRIGQIPVTGRGYSWMTDIDSYHPGGNFVSIPDVQEGSWGGNRFFTLRKTPR
jgi:hypothetical protein